MSRESELISLYAASKGEQKREILLSLCEYRSDETDAFWKKRLQNPGNGYLPYFCFSRSDAVSDYAAEKLEHVVNKLVIVKNQFSAEMTEEAWLALNLSVFKESDKMLEVLRKIGRHGEELLPMMLDMPCLLYSETLPPFLRRQANLAFAHRCEAGFIQLLNDLLICTFARSKGQFLEPLLSLAAEFPEVYGYAGFFALFVNDPHAAFQTYAKPSVLPQLLGTLAGLEYHEDTGTCSQYTPLWFYGVKNRIWQMKFECAVPDENWICWLSRAYCFADVEQRKTLSSLLFQFTWMPQKEQLRDYFFHAAIEDTSEQNLIGLMRCGGYEMTEALIHDICEMICQGRNHYHSLFVVFELLDLTKAEKLRLLSQARGYIESIEHRESWYAQRNHFLHAVTVYQHDKRSLFD